MTYIETAEDYAIRPLPVTGGRREACTPADAPRLDPIVGGEPTPAELAVYREAAAELCAVCPVARLCGAEGDRGAEEGVWGGCLRYLAGGPHGAYRVLPLIPNAVPSVHDKDAVAARLTRKRAVAAAAGEGAP
jgi:hypothetical protein